MAKPKRKPLTDSVRPIQPLPKPDVDLDGLETVTKGLTAAPKPPETKQKPPPRPKKEASVAPTPTRRLSVNVDQKLLARFKAYCAMNNTTIKDKTIELIEKFVAKSDF